jgi:multisubunit Na+/H+ antiporter MnhE subunit
MTRASRVPLLLCWFSEWVLWLVFTDNFGFRELLAGAAAAALATYFSFVFASRRTIGSFSFPREIAAIWRVPSELAHDTGILLLALVQRIAGRDIPSDIVGIPFNAASERPESRGKRALATTLLTVTPNTLVLGILKDEKMLFFHRLLPQPASALARQLSGATGRST